jgi:tetratricopeptide (TPR) repeat protein
LGDMARADADLSKAVQLSPDDPLPWTQRALSHARRGEQDKADADVARAASLRPTPGCELDLAETRTALGRLYWDRDRRAEAHRLWQAALPDLHQVALKSAEDLTMQRRVASCEHQISKMYCDLWLLEFAATAARHNAALNRTTHTWNDMGAAVLLAVAGEQEPWREYCRLVAGRQFDKQPPDESANAMVIRTCLLVDPATNDPEEWIRLAGKALQVKPLAYAAQVSLALAQYRASRYGEALRTIESNRLKVRWKPLYGYLYALATHGEGRREEARAGLERAERTYRETCKDRLDTPQPKSTEVSHKWYWDFGVAQVLRREAWQKIAGQAPPAEPLWHLIRARGYSLLGESERAEKEFAAAVAATPNDYKVWITRAQVLEQLGETARAAADWDKVLELVPDDPLPRFRRALWFVERGEQDKADADLARAASLAPTPGSELELAEARFALGRLYWDKNRRREGHRLWQDVLRDLHKVAVENKVDHELQQRVASREREICHHYGAMGLWDLAATAARHNAALKRITDYHYDVARAALLAASGERESWAAYCRHAETELPAKASPSGLSWDLITLVRTGCLLEPAAIHVDAWLEPAENQPKGDCCRELSLGLLLCRSGRHKEAVEAIESNPASQCPNLDRRTVLEPWSAFLVAIAAHGSLQHESAWTRLQQAEDDCQKIGRAALAPQQTALPGVLAISWWDLANIQVLRREAWQKIKGQAPPADPWWHLVQARGYGLIGESERAEKEFAGAVAAAPNDPEVWDIRARVFEQLGQPARAEADRKKAAELGVGKEAGGARGKAESGEPKAESGGPTGK